jgi:hypothetical protein
VEHILTEPVLVARTWWDNDMHRKDKTSWGSLLAVAAAAILAMGCDKITATATAVGMISRTPDLRDVLPQASELSSVLPIEELDSEPQTLAMAWVGERASATSTDPPTPTTGALVTVTWHNETGTEKRVTLCEVAQEQGPGNYFASTAVAAPCPTPALAYVDNAEYSTEVETDATLHVLQVNAPKALARDDITRDPAIDRVDPTDPYERGKTLTLSWEGGGRDDHVFVTVFRIRYLGDSPADLVDPQMWVADQGPVFDTFPREAAELVHLVAGEPTHQTAVPGTVFNEAGVYVVAVTGVRLSTKTSDNLTFGSAALAGSGVAYGLYVE